jgi:hypothetical protein
MQTTGAAKRKPIKFLDTKVLLATSSLAVTLGLWTLFSRDGLRAELTPPAPESSSPDQADALDLPPLPTLAPLVELPGPAAGQAAFQPADAPQPAPGLALRSVSAQESPVVVQKFKPIVDLAMPAADGGGDDTGSVASTRSSR